MFVSFFISCQNITLSYLIVGFLFISSASAIYAQQLQFSQSETLPPLPPQQQMPQNFLAPPSPTLVEYVNPNLGIRIMVPNNMQITEESPNHVMLTSPDPYFAVSIVIETGGGMTLEQLSSEYLNLSPDPLLGTIIGTKYSMISGYPAYTLLWYSMENQLYTTWVITIKNDISFLLQFVTYEPTFYSLSPLFEQVQASLQFLN